MIQSILTMGTDQIQLVLTALNTSKSAYASFKLTGNKFFSKYQFKPPRSGTQAKDKFYCKIYNKVSNLVNNMPPPFSHLF